MSCDTCISCGDPIVEGEAFCDTCGNMNYSPEYDPIFWQWYTLGILVVFSLVVWWVI